MKIGRFVSWPAVLLAAALSAAACDGKEGGELKYEERTTTIASLKELYRGEPRLLTEDITVVGRVVSSDQRGNFYKSFVVEDPTGGIEVKLDMENIFRSLYYGHRVKIVCCGLWLGSYGGVVQLGAAPAEGFETGRIPSAEAARYVTVVDDGVGPRPESVAIRDIGARHINRFIALENVRFASQECCLAWCDEAPGEEGASSGEYLSTVRHLVDERGDTLDVYTRGEARFAGQRLPCGPLRAEGILSGFNGRYQLRVVFESNVFAE